MSSRLLNFIRVKSTIPYPKMIATQFTIQSQAASPRSAQYVIEPLPQGFGHTLGNSLRRVLFTSIPGAAITTASIPGANHQFATLPGVQEDVVQLVLNLKLVRLTYTGSEPVRITISAKGPGTVTAGDFQTPPSVTIANPELVLAHLSDKSAKLELEATVETGLGYSPAEDRQVTTIGMIPLDASFTPVTIVNFSVEATRVGRVTNFDKLILDITTDGTISPSQALKQASLTLVDYFTVLSNPDSVIPPPGPFSDSKQPSSSPALSIEELDLPTRIANALQKAGLETVSQLLATPRSELAKVKNLGSKSVKIIDLALKDKGFELI